MYTHLVQYYETDKMGVTHHSNYIRWMEEARISFLEESGWSFSRLEAEGLVSPVISLKCDYRKPTTFSDSVDIEVGVKEMKGIRVVLSYIMKKGDDIVCEAESTHCFMRKDGHVMRIEREMPEFSAFVSCVQREVDVCNNTDSTCCAKMIPPLWQAAPSDRTYQRRKTQVIHENDY